MPFALPLIAFIVAATPFGLIIGRLVKGIDIREHGSGNIGTTNVFRVLGKGPGIVCLILDILKGFLPVVAAINLLQFVGREPVPHVAFLDSLAQVRPASEQFFVQLIHIVTALFAILGHNYSPWLKFKGGKGIATSAGVLLALMPAAVALLILIFLAVFLTSRYVSLASITAAACLPLLTFWGSWYHGRIADGTWNKPLFIFSIVVAVLAIWKHRSNIERLRNGTENRFGKKKQQSSTEN
ncbi:glycerol-3-phosphate 1-O-acyltransferase PlsY [Roseibacillus ishigakijimensis]|uniref:Glycerol-3-phosphate acyltransferase n=1 Tax=Roseibacillus ishigakijimensis TaxID=454146 RepID=A0A934VLQ1_9BACT|nr:glycerol-3-phosphate 1-O-acyltransferase PlsY [Roseibacillus ishigakijimensis]MBK1834919.1 glycerol-3-phosphate 1-O-acyltransferase PlsY [Roseibacillus ishigakijimensis]